MNYGVLDDKDEVKPKEISTLGLISMFIGLATLFVFITMYFVFSVLAVKYFGQVNDGSSLIMGLIIILCLLLNLVGFILGVIALFQKNKRKVHSIIGVISNLLILLIIALILIVALVYVASYYG